MSEASAAQWYFDPPDPKPCWWCGHDHRKDDETCPDCFMGCEVLEGDEEPPELEDYMMQKRGLIE